MPWNAMEIFFLVKKGWCMGVMCCPAFARIASPVVAMWCSLGRRRGWFLHREKCSLMSVYCWLMLSYCWLIAHHPLQIYPDLSRLIARQCYQFSSYKHMAGWIGMAIIFGATKAHQIMASRGFTNMEIQLVCSCCRITSSSQKKSTAGIDVPAVLAA